MAQCKKCEDRILGDENNLCGNCAGELATESEEEELKNL